MKWKTNQKNRGCQQYALVALDNIRECIFLKFHLKSWDPSCLYWHRVTLIFYWRQPLAPNKIFFQSTEYRAAYVIIFGLSSAAQ